MSTEPDPAVVALGRLIQRALSRLDALDTGLRRLADDVSAITPRSSDPTDGDVPALRSWLAATDPEEAAADLVDLVAWIDRVYLRFGRAALPSCWLWHPEAIEELWWLRCAHADAFHPETGSWLRVGDWHDRQRPGVQRRLDELLIRCHLSRHVERNGRPAVSVDPTPAALGHHAAAIAAAWTGPDATAPTPTDEQLAEAEQYENDSAESIR